MTRFLIKTRSYLIISTHRERFALVTQLRPKTTQNSVDKPQLIIQSNSHGGFGLKHLTDRQYSSSKMSCVSCDDKAYWEAQVPIIAAKDLDKFLAAAKEGDKKSIGNLFQSLLSTVKSAQANNEVLLPRINWIVTRTAAFANSDLGIFQRVGLYSLVRLVNGKRDNKSYYTLDAVREWIARRLPSVTGKLNADMIDVQARAVDSRDFLDSHAQVFVAGIKELVRLTASDTLKNAAEIRAVANSMLADVKEIPVLTDKTQGLVDAVKQIIDSQK